MAWTDELGHATPEELARAGAGTTGTVQSTFKSGGPNGITETHRGADTPSTGGTATTTTTAILVNHIVLLNGNSDGSAHIVGGRSAGAGGTPASSVDDSQWHGMPGVISYHCAMTVSVNGEPSSGFVVIESSSGIMVSGRRQLRSAAGALVLRSEDLRADVLKGKAVDKLLSLPPVSSPLGPPLQLKLTTCFSNGTETQIFRRSPELVTQLRADQLYKDGYTVLNFLLEDNVVPKVRQTLATFPRSEFIATTLNASDVPASSNNDSSTKFTGDQGRSRMCLSRINTTAATILASRVQDFAQSIGSYALPGIVIRRARSCGAQIWHRDGEHHGYVLVVALQDEYNVTVCPGTHLVESHVHLRAPYCVPIQLQAGQALMFDQLTLHGGNANLGSGEQYGVHIYLQDSTEMGREGLMSYVQRRSWSQHTGSVPC
jgi:hypothetical protein